MRRGVRGSRLLAAALLTLGMAASREAAASPADDEAAIRAALQDWVRNTNAGNYKAAATVWAPDLLGWWGPPGSADDSFEREMKAAERGVPPGAPRTSYELTIDEVLVSGDLAVVRDIWVESTQAADGSPPRRKTFRSFEVWRRQPDRSWKIARWIDGPEKELDSPASPNH